jgi:hypothetical protein
MADGTERHQVVQVVGIFPINRFLTSIHEPSYFSPMVNVNAHVPIRQPVTLMATLLAGILIPVQCLLALAWPIRTVPQFDYQCSSAISVP